MLKEQKNLSTFSRRILYTVKILLKKKKAKIKAFSDKQKLSLSPVALYHNKY